MELRIATGIYLDKNGAPVEQTFKELYSPETGTRVALISPDTGHYIHRRAYDETVKAFQKLGKLSPDYQNAYRDEITSQVKKKQSRYEKMTPAMQADYEQTLLTVGLDRSKVSKRIIADHDLHDRAAVKEGVFDINGHPVRGCLMENITAITFCMGQTNMYVGQRIGRDIQSGTSIRDLARSIRNQISGSTEESAAAIIAKAAPVIEKIRQRARTQPKF